MDGHESDSETLRLRAASLARGWGGRTPCQVHVSVKSVTSLFLEVLVERWVSGRQSAFCRCRGEGDEAGGSVLADRSRLA